MFFQQPIWFLLLLPISVSLYLWRTPSRVLILLRVFLTLCVVLAMTVPMLQLPRRFGTVAVLADRSLSMPQDAADKQKQAVELLQQYTGENHLEIVTFAEKAFRDMNAAEIRAANASGSFDGSDLTAAIQTGLSLIPVGDSGRILFLSDGRWTGENPNTMIAELVQRSIAVDYRIIERPAVGDIAIHLLDAPDTVLPNEVFRTTAWVETPTAQTVDYELLQNETVAAKGKRMLRRGNNRLDFLLQAGKAGTTACELRITPSDKTSDPMPENNAAKKLVEVKGNKPVLLVHSSTAATSGKSSLPTVLNYAGIDTETTDGAGVRWSLEFLSRYSAVVLENVPASQLGVPAMELLAEWVKETGAGLMMTGGKNAYALGGYYQSPLDSIMPVSMELRKEHRKLAVAVAVVMDCSGSMGMTVAGGRIKMDLANLGAAEVVKILSPMDEVAVMTCDTEVQKIVPLKMNTSPAADRSRILATGPGGGGIFVYTALLAATRELMKAKAETKHIILFTDADDTENPQDYVKLMTANHAAGITCSVIALGTPKDSTAALCIDIAKRGNGSIYFTEQANDLPRLFAQDTFTISRQTFLEDPTAFHFTGGMTALTGTPYQTAKQTVGGYNLSYLKPEALLSAATDDEYEAPLIASHQIGLGRVLCYTGEADGKFTGAMTTWKDYPSMLASLVKWTAGENKALPNEMMLTQTVQDGVCKIRLLLDGDKPFAAGRALPALNILKQKATAVFEKETKQLIWLAPDILGVDIPLTGRDVVQATLMLKDSSKEQPYSLSPVCLPYSPEFQPSNASHGIETLKFLAAATGGKERTDLTGIWQDLLPVPRSIDLSQGLVFLAMFLFVLEIFERRTNWLGRFRKGGRQSFPPATPIPSTLNAAIEDASNESVSGAMRKIKRKQR